MFKAVKIYSFKMLNVSGVVSFKNLLSSSLQKVLNKDLHELKFPHQL